MGVVGDVDSLGWKGRGVSEEGCGVIVGIERRRWQGESCERTYDDAMSPKNAFSFATSGGLKLDCAFSKYCIAGIVAVTMFGSGSEIC